MDCNTLIGVKVGVSVTGTTVTLREFEPRQVWPGWVEDSYVRSITKLPIISQTQEMLLDGVPDIEVAAWIREQGYFTEQKPDTVRVYVSHFRATIPKILFLRRQRPLSPKLSRAENLVKKQIDTLEMMEDLLEHQADRIRRFKNFDKMSPIPIDNFDKEARTAKMLIDSVEGMRKAYGMHKTQRDIVDAKAVDMDKVYQTPGLNKVIANPQSRLRLLRIMDQMEELRKRKEKVEVIAAPIENVPDSVEVVDLDNVEGVEYDGESDDGQSEAVQSSE